MADSLKALARDLDRATLAYMSCDPASPAADTARAGVHRTEMHTLTTRMGILADFDMGRVREAIYASESEIVRRVRLRGHYTDEDLRQARQDGGVRPG